MRKPRKVICCAILWVWAASFDAANAPEPAPELWPPARITEAMRALERMKADGLITERQFQRKRAMIEERRAGRFKSSALSQTDPAELNLLQNAGFEEVNRNSDRNRSRWLWWGGWSWGGDYENFWETRKEYVHSGNYSAGIRCTGQPGAGKARVGSKGVGSTLISGIPCTCAIDMAKGANTAREISASASRQASQASSAICRATGPSIVRMARICSIGLALPFSIKLRPVSLAMICWISPRNG